MTEFPELYGLAAVVAAVLDQIGTARKNIILQAHAKPSAVFGDHHMVVGNSARTRIEIGHMHTAIDPPLRLKCAHLLRRLGIGFRRPFLIAVARAHRYDSAPEPGSRFENGDREASLRELIGRAEPSRTGADHRHREALPEIGRQINDDLIGIKGIIGIGRLSPRQRRRKKTETGQAMVDGPRRPQDIPESKANDDVIDSTWLSLSLF